MREYDIVRGAPGQLFDEGRLRRAWSDESTRHALRRAAGLSGVSGIEEFARITAVFRSGRLALVPRRVHAAPITECCGTAGPGTGGAATSRQFGDLVIRLDLDPSDARRRQDRFILSSSDGSYRSEKTIRDDRRCADRYVDLLFTRLPTDLRYGLQILGGPGRAACRAFRDVPYSALADLSPSSRRGGRP